MSGLQIEANNNGTERHQKWNGITADDAHNQVNANEGTSHRVADGVEHCGGQQKRRLSACFAADHRPRIGRVLLSFSLLTCLLPILYIIQFAGD